MNLHQWLVFLVSTILICSAPGPNMLMMLSSGLRHGVRRTLPVMFGCYCALLVILVASVVGLGAILKTEPLLFTILKYFGALYLAYLGVQAWRSDSNVGLEASDVIVTDIRTYDLIRKGFLVGISNPKALLFATAFFPQFISADAPATPQFLILLVTFSVIELACYTAYAAGGTKLSEYMSRYTVRKIFNRLIGSLFLLFGIFLVESKIN